MKLGIIGSGGIVQEFLPRLTKLEGLEVRAVQGVPEQLEQIRQLCAENQVEYALTSFEELCKTDIDTVYVAVPNFLHYEYCRKALEKGFHVIVEKPITSNVGEAKELAEMARSKRLFLFEAITTVHLGNYKKIQEWLPRIGDIKLVTMNYSQYSRRYDDFRKGIILPAFDPQKSGGALMDLNLYNLHFVMGLFGKPMDVKYYANVERGIDTSGMLILTYEGFAANCTAAKDCKGPFLTVIEGTDGYITAKYPPNIIGEVKLQLNDGTEEAFDDGMYANRLIPEFTTFMRAIHEENWKLCYDHLEKSVNVSEVQTKARMDAGICFPADRKYV